jgi:hypothetical protein
LYVGNGVGSEVGKIVRIEEETTVGIALGKTVGSEVGNEVRSGAFILFIYIHNKNEIQSSFSI